MKNNDDQSWPSGDSKPVLATMRTPEELVWTLGVKTFHGKDDLDNFTAAWVSIEPLGQVLIMKHENSPSGLTVAYVDAASPVALAESRLEEYFKLACTDVAWRLSEDLDEQEDKK